VVLDELFSIPDASIIQDQPLRPVTIQELSELTSGPIERVSARLAEVKQMAQGIEIPQTLATDGYFVVDFTPPYIDWQPRVIVDAIGFDQDLETFIPRLKRLPKILIISGQRGRDFSCAMQLREMGVKAYIFEEATI
jgi:hypothetical protein